MGVFGRVVLRVISPMKPAIFTVAESVRLTPKNAEISAALAAGPGDRKRGIQYRV